LKTVIVVDDDKDIVSVISELLELNEMKVIGIGYDGLEGFELFERLKPDLVLLDMMMPEYDGLYALKKIREKDASANVVIITGGYPDSVEDELQSLNPTKILFKPFDVNALTDLFPVKTHAQPAFKIKYKFQNDDNYYTCILSNEQYENFKKLPVLQECEILTKDEKNVKEHASKIQKALNLAAENDTSHILKLSANV
jgi:CheY-like chemotaxis protein